MSLQIGILLYPEVEVLDFAGPFEVFTTAARVNQVPWQVSLIAQQQQLVRARGGLQVMPDYGFENAPTLDVLLVPGGVHDGQMSNTALIGWLKQQWVQVPQVVSVCTGVFLLAQAGVLGTRRVTTHWEDINGLQQQFAQLDVISGPRWVEDQGFISSAGISAGLDMSLQLVSRLLNPQAATDTAKQMDYQWCL